MEKKDALKEATSNIIIENKPLNKEELSIIREALEEKDKSFIKTLYEKVMAKNDSKRK